MQQQTQIILTLPTICDTMYQYSHYYGDDPRLNDGEILISTYPTNTIKQLKEEVNKQQQIIGFVKVVQRSMLERYPREQIIYFFETDRWNTYCEDNEIIQDVYKHINDKFFLGAVLRDQNSTKQNNNSFFALQ